MSYLGYRLHQQTITVNGPQTINPLLAPTSNQLREVVVQARRHRNDPRIYALFEEMLLGYSTFSRQCRIPDSGQIVVDFNDSTRTLTASAPEFLTIENQALGYRVTYYGLQFRAYLKQQVVFFTGRPVFSDLPTRSARTRRRWQQNRRAAYLGSLTHFLRAVYDNQVSEQGFVVQRVRQDVDPRRLLADSLMARLQTSLPNEQQVFSGGTGTILAGTPRQLPGVSNASLERILAEPRAYEFLYNPPLPIDSMRRLSPGGTRWLRFTDQLRITYGNEFSDPRYTPPQTAPTKSQTAPTGQSSTLYALSPEVQLLPFGQLAEPLAVFSEGYWGFEKMGEFLPVDYLPNPLPASDQKP